jgi:hypothetical protein
MEQGTLRFLGRKVCVDDHAHEKIPASIDAFRLLLQPKTLLEGPLGANNITLPA